MELEEDSWAGYFMIIIKVKETYMDHNSDGFKEVVDHIAYTNT